MFKHQSIERALTRLILIASGTVLLLACGTFLGYELVASNLEIFRERFWIYTGLAIVAIVLPGLIVIPLSDRLQRHVSQPIQALADTAKAVSERRDYSVRAAKFHDDETPCSQPLWRNVHMKVT